MSYSRRCPRVAFRCPIMLTTQGGETMLGQVVDLSARGAGIVLNVPGKRLPIGTRVSGLIEAHELPDPDGDGGVISVRGVVAWVTDLGVLASGGPTTRLGLDFPVAVRGLAPRLAHGTLVGELADGTGSSPTLVAAGPPGPTLAKSGRGRELLYQHAHERLGAGEAALAAQAIGWALTDDPKNHAYRVLHHRAIAEQALARGDRDAARREAEGARALAPLHADVVALLARVGVAVAPQAARKGILGRLFSR